MNEITESRTWRCFFCDDVFDREEDAREHFGSDRLYSQPGCRIKGHEHGLLGYIRAQEVELAEHRAENTPLIQAMAAMRCEHAEALRHAEECGYSKGVRDLKRIAEQQFGAEVVV